MHKNKPEIMSTGQLWALFKTKTNIIQQNLNPSQISTGAFQNK